MENNKDKEEKNKNRIFIEVAPYMNLSWQMLITIGLFILLGWWLDGKFETKPILILVGAFLGIALAFYNFFRTISELEKKEKGKK